MVGAVAGTPGTLPTNWQALGGGLGTLTQTISTGTSGGIAYIDIRLNGTTSTTSYGIGFDLFTQIAAAVGQTWTSSFYVARVGGTTTNISSINNRIVDRDAGGGNLASGLVDFLPTLSTTFARSTNTRTLAGVGTACISNDVLFAFASGVAIDITLRIGLPQLEQGAFATSVIPTTTTALTRSADVASVNTLSPWYNSVEGTLYGEFAVPPNLANFPNTIGAFSDGTTSNQIASYAVTSGLYTTIRTGGVSQGDPGVVGSPVVGTNAKYAIAVQTNNCIAAWNGAIGVVDASVTLPTVDRFRLGVNGAGNGIINGHIRRIVYYPRRLANADLQAITT